MSGPIKTYPTSKSGSGLAKSVTSTDIAGDKVALDVQVAGGAVTGTFTGSVTVSGLNIQGRNTTMNITSTAASMPATALTLRNAMTVTNLSGTDTLYVGFDSSVTADSVVGTTSGFPVGPQQGFNLDITPNVVLYGIAEAGKTIKIIITELA
jgi:hypothetical protein